MPFVRICGRGFQIPDLDKLFCYDTPKLLRVIDFKPGVVYRAGIAFVILYCFGFALVVNQMYLEQTDALGVAMIEVDPSAEKTLFKSQIRPDTGKEGGKKPVTGQGAWDRFDLVYPPTEIGGIFITTRRVSTRGQIMKECPDTTTTYPTCKSKMPIYPGLKYPGTTYCMEYTWCPKFGQGGAASTDEVLKGQEIEDLELNVRLYLNWFPQSNPNKIVSQTQKVKLKELLKAAGVETIDEVRDTGCVIYLKYSFGTAKKTCGTSDVDCEPELQVVRLDQKSAPGFKYRRANYYRGNGTTPSQPREIRDVSRMIGIRIVATASGRGETFSLIACMLQVASALAMWRLVYFVADIFTVFLNLKAFKYYEFKYAKTPDFGDLKEAAEAKKIDAQANKKGKRPRINRARVKASAEDEDEG